MYTLLHRCGVGLALCHALGGMPPAIAEGNPSVAAEAAQDENLPLSADTLKLLRGRWNGLWTFADGSQGRLRLEVEQAEAGRIAGVLRYFDTAYTHNESIRIDAVPQLDAGRVGIAVDGVTLSWQLKKSGEGYRLLWSSPASGVRLPAQNELHKGAVTPRPPQPVPAEATAAVSRNDPGSALPADWHRNGAFMQIHVRAFKDSDGDGVGDLKGLISGLDYLRDLGIKGLWLMPVQASQDHDHGYAVIDYRAIEPAYGTLADFDALLKAAHARGMGVIIDYVINHSAALNPIFQNSAYCPDSLYRDWYVWETSKPEDWSIYGRNPWYKTAHGYYFGGFSSQMPDWNLRKREVVDYHFDNLRFWLNRGVDGFRFDAVGNLFENGAHRWERQRENYGLMREVRAMLDGYARRFMVCESPPDPVGFAEACGSAFAFGHNRNLIKGAQGDERAIQALARYPLEVAPVLMSTLLSNHDAFAGRRVQDQFGGDAAGYRLAAATYLTQPGVPFVYYGEEIGMAGAKGLAGDTELRGPLSWTGDPLTAGFSTVAPFRPTARNVENTHIAGQLQQPDSLLAFYRTLLKLRQQNPALARGSYEQAVAQGTTLSFQRKEGKNRVLAVFNYGKQPARLDLLRLPAKARLKPLLSGGKAFSANAGGEAQLELGPQSFALYSF